MTHRVPRSIHRLVSIVTMAVLVVACTPTPPPDERGPTEEGRPTDELRPTEEDGSGLERAPAQEPLPAVLDAVQQFRAADPEASFSYFNGHVDSFATTAKDSIPDYARATLAELGLSTEAREPRRLGEPLDASQIEKPSRDLDADLTQAIPLPREEEDVREESPDEQRDDASDELGEEQLPEEAERSEPAETDPPRIEWTAPDAREIALQEAAVVPILAAFLDAHREVFEFGAEDLERSLELVDYRPGAFANTATFEQRISEDESLLYGRTLVLFDVNWNVIGISRMLSTPEKLALEAAEGGIDDPDRAVERASRAWQGLPQEAAADCRGKDLETLRAEPAVDPIRKARVWDVELISGDGDCHYRAILARETGETLNVSDLIDRHAADPAVAAAPQRHYTDARLNRWAFPGGDLFSPRQVVSPDIYTRNDRRLEHDFFYVMNDHRCEGDPETNCSQTAASSTWCSKAHGNYDGSSWIRATRRTDRDFSGYYPWGASEAFAETNTYYWARWFAQWLKPSLDAMGVLPSSASDFMRVLIITDACRSGSVHNSVYQVTTDDDKGEGTNVIRLAHGDPSGSSNHNRACEGSGCFDNPSNIDHELNHFYLKRYYDVGSDLDCGGGVQLKFTHEGILGTAAPHAFWHAYYGIGYSPVSTNQLYFSNTDIGRVHTNDDNRLTISQYLCVENTDDPYRAGRVVGQALWEFYHGRKVSGSSIGNTWYPSTDTDFNILVYWAAELQAASTYKDRYEYANRLMEILDKHSNWSSAGKQDYCEIFEHHELDPFIDADYCS